MKTQTSIEFIKMLNCINCDFKDECETCSYGIAIKCMKELEQYRALGTVEELKEAREKQVAKKPIGKYTDYKCSVCGRRVRSGKGSSSRQRDNFCQRCGTKIDWEEGAE